MLEAKTEEQKKKVLEIFGSGLSHTKKNKKVCLRIDGVNHHLCKYKGWVDGGKYNWACPNCSLYKTHFKYCWNIDDAKGGSPLCSILASANNWDEDFAVYFKTINRKQRR